MSKVIRVPAEIPASGRRVAYAEIPISDVVVTVEIYNKQKENFNYGNDKRD